MFPTRSRSSSLLRTATDFYLFENFSHLQFPLYVGGWVLKTKQLIPPVRFQPPTSLSHDLLFYPPFLSENLMGGHRATFSSSSTLDASDGPEDCHGSGFPSLSYRPPPIPLPRLLDSPFSLFSSPFPSRHAPPVGRRLIDPFS